MHAFGTDPSIRINLDLSALIFVDAAGERLLRDLIARGIEVVACSGYVAELLRSRAGGTAFGSWNEIHRRRTLAKDFTVARQQPCRCFGVPFGSPGERIMSLLVRACAALRAADRQLSRTYYQVLGISPEEQDPRVIEEAALRCSAHVRSHQYDAQESECTQRLNEIARALITLLDPVSRREYDLGPPSTLPPARGGVGAAGRPVGESTPAPPQWGKSRPAQPGPRILSCFSSGMGKRVASKLELPPAGLANGQSGGIAVGNEHLDPFHSLERKSASIPSPAWNATSPCSDPLPSPALKGA